MQRAAIARALVHQPGAARRRRAHRQPRLGQRRHACWRCCAELNREIGITILLATHAADVAAAAARTSCGCATAGSTAGRMSLRLFRQFIVRRLVARARPHR